MNNNEKESDEENVNLKKQTVGLVERVIVKGLIGQEEVEALFDTGATRSSIDYELAGRVGLGPIVGSVKVKSKTDPTGFTVRPVVMGEIQIDDIREKVQMTLSDRSDMSYPLLIGRDIIHPYFIVDPEKSHSSPNIEDKKEVGEEENGEKEESS